MQNQTRGEFKKIKELFESVYLIDDPYIIKVLVASVINQRLKGDPCWIIFVGPSGSGKSEFVNSIYKCQNLHCISTLTSHTFISGQNKGQTETSLLLKIQNGIITFKDFTSMLSENRDERAVIMSQLREIYDGKMSKSFGTGQTVNWSGKITVIAASTYVIHSLKQQYTAMGERFLFYNIIQPDRIKSAEKAMNNQEEGDMAEKREEIATHMAKYLDEYIKIPEQSQISKIDNDLKQKLLELSNLATMARSDVERNLRSPQMEITDVHPAEAPARFAGQLQNYAKSLMIINWNETGFMGLLPEDEVILYKIALDSITKSKRIAMQELSKYDIIETSGLATKLGMPTNTVRRWLEDLVALQVADRMKGSGPRGDKWTIKEEYRKIICKFEGISKEGEELIEEVNNSNIISQEEIDAAMEN